MLRIISIMSISLVAILSCSYIRCSAPEAVYYSLLNNLENIDKELTKLGKKSQLSGEDIANIELLQAQKDSIEQEINKLVMTQEPTPGLLSTNIDQILDRQNSPGYQETKQDLQSLTYLASAPIKIPNYDIKLPALPYPVTFYFLPTLQQTRNEKDQTNYCGYYAIFNALRLSQAAPTDNPANRVEPTTATRLDFLTYFEHWLNIVQDHRNRYPHEITDHNKNLSLISDLEILDIIDQAGLQISFAPLHTIISSPMQFSEIASALGEQYKALHEFTQQAGPKSISFIGGTKTLDGHWFALRADKEASGNLTLYVADSLHRPEWYMENEYFIITRILPYAYILMGKIDEAKEIFNLVQ